VPEIFQVRCLETDELFEVDACNAHTAAERASTDPACAAANEGAHEPTVQRASATVSLLINATASAKQRTDRERIY
jgi:hypothetical protein